MAKGIINLQKASGGITKISSADGTGVTELVVPESGNLVSVDTAVTDNAIARYDGTTGKLQNSGVIVDDSGNLLLTSGTGALGYGAGAGGTVKQLTSINTAVTLNKLTGSINTFGQTLSAGQTVRFVFNNTFISPGLSTIFYFNHNWGEYYDVNFSKDNEGVGSFNITVKQATGTSRPLSIVFAIIKGSAN